MFYVWIISGIIGAIWFYRWQRKNAELMTTDKVVLTGIVFVLGPVVPLFLFADRAFIALDKTLGRLRKGMK